MQETETVKNAAQRAWQKRPLIISGPCSAETEEQVLETAQRLAATGKIDMLRAGIWKPRTRPGSAVLLPGGPVYRLAGDVRVRWTA